MTNIRYDRYRLSYEKKVSWKIAKPFLLILLFQYSLYEHLIGVKWCFSRRQNFLKLMYIKTFHKDNSFLWKRIIYCPKRLCSVQQMFLDYLPFGSEVSTATPLQLCHRVKPPSSSGRGTLTREKCDYHWTAAQWQTFVGLEKTLRCCNLGQQYTLGCSPGRRKGLFRRLHQNQNQTKRNSSKPLFGHQSMLFLNLNFHSGSLSMAASSCLT